MSAKLKNRLLAIFYALILGVIVGLVLIEILLRLGYDFQTDTLQALHHTITGSCRCSCEVSMQILQSFNLYLHIRSSIIYLPDTIRKGEECDLVQSMKAH